MQDMMKMTQSNAAIARIGDMELDLSGNWTSKLTEFRVVADKNVATLLVTPKDEHRSIQIDWGDGNREFVDFKRSPLQRGFDVPEGSFKFLHVYQKNPMTGLMSDSAYVVLTVYNSRGEKSFEGAMVTISGR